MTESAKHDAWSAGDAYQHYMGRWSDQIAVKFIEWLEPEKGMKWLDVGCGTGALTGTILRDCAPASVTGIDPSQSFIDDAGKWITDPRVQFQTGDAMNLGDADQYDSVTSALMLNFVPDMAAALREMQRALKPGGTLSFYVWDYPSGGMGFIDAFWKAAAKLDPNAGKLDESNRFSDCTEAGLKELCTTAGLPSADVTTLEITTVFKNLEAFWAPFTLGAGPAPGYCMQLSQAKRAALKSELEQAFGTKNKINLPARAWAVKAIVGS